ncbi:MAG: hypothetical protein LBM61_08460 [Prevotellaceae bacterium]|jgi:long-chain fatty acid transport protein|nr:hypothetical protein [Prevotellaceae bacterium]
MKRNILLSILVATAIAPSFAGGILTHTNQSIQFLRMIARGATVDVDGVYYNPAGLAFLEDGTYLSLNIQSAYQTRSISSQFALFPLAGDATRNYKANVNAPVLPSVFAVYKTNNWAFSGSFAVIGGGGKADFKTGLPMFDKLTMSTLAAYNIMPNAYELNSAVEGSQYAFGVQLGASYRLSDSFAVFGGARIDYMQAGYNGFIRATLHSNPNATPMDLGLDVKQSTWGVTPILGVDMQFGNLNASVKYEFKTSATFTNKTLLSGESSSDPTLQGTLMAAGFGDGAKVPNDIPALLQVAAGYEFLPNLRAGIEYHHFYDRKAGMGAAHKEQYLTGGTNEYLGGVEWDINDRFTVSGGYQKTDYGLSDEFQSDLSFSLDSYSIGLGGAIRLNESLRLNVAYFWTTYDDYVNDATANGVTNVDTYSRTNKVFGIGIDYTF